MYMCIFSVAQLLSCVQFFAIPWTAACQASLSFTISGSLPYIFYIYERIEMKCYTEYNAYTFNSHILRKQVLICLRMQIPKIYHL